MKITPYPRLLGGQRVVLLATLGLGVIIHGAYAANVTWIGNTSNLWNIGSNWSTSAVPANGDTLVFGTPGSAGVAIVNDITGLTVGGIGTDGIVFGPGANSHTVTRSGTQVITLGSSAGGIAVKNLSPFAQTWNVPFTSSTAQTVQIGDTTGAASSSLATTTGGWVGGFRLTKTGTGLLSLGNNNVLGGLTINQGTVNIASDAQLSIPAPSSPTSDWIVINGGALRTNVNAGWILNANRGIAVGDTTEGSGGTINVMASNGAAANTLTLTYNGVISNNGGANSLTKTGNQILALGGTNTYSGATKINQGQLTLDFAAASAPTSNIINSSSTLVMGGYASSLLNTAAGAPILLVQGRDTGTSAQTFNGAAFTPGNSSVIARGGASGSTTLALGAITHSPGGTVGFSVINNGGVANITTTTSNTNGILGGFATTGASTAGTGTTPVTQTDWAANDGNGNIVAYTGYTLTSGATPTIANNAASNLRITNASTGNLTPAFVANLSELNTIQSTDTLARVIAIGAGNTLRLGEFGGVWTASSGALTIGASTAAGGTLTAGGAANTAGEIVFNSGALITVNSVIADNGSGAVTLVKTGTAGLTLNGNNSFTGGTFINQGTVTATSVNAFGGAGRDVTVLTGASVSLAPNGGLTYANNFNLAGSALSLGGTFSGGAIGTVGNIVTGTVTLMGDTTIGNSGTNGTIAGKITGDYNLSVLGALTLSNNTNDYSGHLGINGVNGAVLGGNPVTLKLGDNEVLAHGTGKGNVYISGGATGPTLLDLNGKTATINGLISAGTVAQVRITNTNTATATLKLGDNDQTTTYAGTIIDGAGIVRIEKIGKGIQTFSGLNTYTGGTAVDEGTLAIAANFTMTGSNRISIASTGFAGTDYATMRSTTGTLTFAGTLDIHITASLSGGESFTLFSANGGALAGNFSNVSLSGSYLASLTDNGSGIWTGSANGFDFAFAASGVNAGVLSVSAVPEPSTYAALFGILALGSATLRRRRGKPIA